jgi:dienelactone hydrolase
LGHPGGYLIEDNTFRRSRTAVRVQNGSSEPTVIRGNTFRNHNDVSTPEPPAVPLGNRIANEASRRLAKEVIPMHLPSSRSTARIMIWTVGLTAWSAMAAGQTPQPVVEKAADAAAVFPIWPGPPPGGANLFLSIDHEGYEVARWFAKRGVTAFVLRYRVRPTPRDTPAFADRLMQVIGTFSSAEDPCDGSTRWFHAAEDGRQAFRIIRERAREWNIDPRRVGIVGFSAGGFVVNEVAVQHDEESRPDFAASIYAGLLGPVTVPEDAPPLFIAYAVDDPWMSGRVLPLFTAWRDAGKPVELHAYETGGHGFAMSVQNTTSDRWIDAFRAWLAHHGLISDAQDGEPS